MLVKKKIAVDFTVFFLDLKLLEQKRKRDQMKKTEGDF